MIWFDRQSATDLTAMLELRVRVGGRRSALPFALRIDHGQLRVRPGAPHDPGVTATIGARDLVRLGVGRVGWPELLSSGQLKLTGDPFLALRFPSLFRLRASAKG